MRHLFAWLATRFPEQRVVSLAEFQQIQAELYRMNQVLVDLHSRLVQTEAQVKRLNDVNGYVNATKGQGFKLER